MNTPIQKSAAWQSLLTHAARRQPLPSLFADNDQRFEQLSLTVGDLLLDFSKTALTKETLRLLLDLAITAEITTHRDALFAGAIVNQSESRAALHTALRGHANTSPAPNQSILSTINNHREAMLHYADECRQGRLVAANGKAFTDIVNIGIGGSYLGPAMTVAALAPYHDGPRVHFIANMDGSHLADTLSTLDGRQTLIIISSKTFTTIETITNMRIARQWLIATIGEAQIDKQLVAVTADVEQAQQAGIKRLFPYWSWVGGRYSIWSAVGLPLAIAIGSAHFKDFLSGADSIDTHFQSAPMTENLPLILGLIGVWHRNFCAYPTRAILAYDQRLRLLPDYLQQLDMESNGKTVTQNGATVGIATAPVVWGGVGTTAQHAFFQMLHQGTDIVPCEFIIAARGFEDSDEQQQLLVANCFAQSAALMHGDNAPQPSPHQHCLGNRPSITLLYRQLTAYTLGQLIAVYEHRTFVEGIIWGVNSFDQWGVELGKNLSQQLHQHLTGKQQVATLDASTYGLLQHYQKMSTIPPKK